MHCILESTLSCIFLFLAISDHCRDCEISLENILFLLTFACDQKKVTVGGHISVMIGYYKGACETPARGSYKNIKIRDRVNSKD